MSDFESKINIDIDAGGALAAIKTLQRQISDFHTSLAKGSATANIKSLQMQQTLIDTINATGQYSASMKTVASSTQTFTTALEKNKLSMGQYFKYAGGASKSFGRFFKTEMDTIQKVAIERVKDLQTQYVKMGRDANGAIRTIAVRPLALDMKNLSTQTQVAAQKQQLLNQLLKQGSTNLLNFGKNTQWAGRQLMVGFTIPLGILGTTAARTFMEMEKQAIAFKRVYGDTFTATKETDAMLKQVQQLASEFTKYGVAVEKTMEQAAKAAATGKMGADLLAQVSEATRLSVLGNVEQQQALETTISLTNAFGTAADELRGKINFLNAVENQTVTSIEDLTVAIPKAAPVIKQLGGNVEDLTFFLTAMREGGINASESANALKSGLASLINPTKKASDFMSGFGINLNKIVEGNRGDVKGLVIEFAQALDTLDPLNRARAIEQLFGKFQFSRLSTLFQNVIKDGSQAARVLELTRQSSAELGILAQRELNRIAASPMYKFEKAIADFKKELAPVGEEFLKAVTPIINFATDVLKAFNNLDGGVKQFIVNATGLIAGIGPVFLMTFGLLANGVANIIKGFTFVKNVFNKTASASTILGETTDYMTQQQLEAAAVASSLEQVHNKLTQAFTSETSAVNNLASAYQKAISAQTAFTGPATVGKRAPKPKKYADGVFSVPGPKGAGDVVPAMLSPGEAVIPAKMASKYSGFISGMISGNIPGFNKGKIDARQKVRSAPKTILEQVRALFGAGWTGQKEERDAIRKAVLAEADARGLVDTEEKKARSNFLSKYGFGKAGPVDSTHLASMGDDKYFTSKNVIPDHRALNQVFADAVEGRISRDGKVSAIGEVLKDKKIIAKMAAQSGLDEKTLVRELKKMDPRRVGGAIYPTTESGIKALKSFYENTDRPTPGTRIASAGLRERLKVGGKAGGFIEGVKSGGKARLDPKLDDKALEEQKVKIDKSENKERKKGVAAVKKHTQAVNADTAETKKGTRIKRDANKTAKKAKTEATPTVKTKELLEGGITRHSGIDSRGRSYVKYTDENGLPLKNAEAEARLAGTGAKTKPGGRIRGILTGLPGKLGIGALATMGVGAATGNEQISSISDQLFQAAMLASFIPQETMGKMKAKIKNSPRLQAIKGKFDATKMGGRFAEAGSAAKTFKLDAAASVASKGLMKSFPMLAKGASMVALRFLNVIPVVGQVALALEILYSVATVNAKKQQEVSEAIVETLTMTKEKLDKVNEFFGSDAKLSGIRTATVASAGQGGGEASLAEQFRQSEQFQSLYKPQAEKLKDASKKQFMFTMQSLGLDLYAQGMSEEQVQIIIDAIKKEAGQTDLVIKFKDLKLDTEAGKANFSKAVQEIGAEVTKQFQSNRDFLGINWEAQSKLDELESQIAGFMSATSQEFVNGRMSAQEFTATSNEMYLSMVKMEQANPGDGLNFLNDVIGRLNPELQKALAFIDSLSTKSELVDLARMGIQLPQQLINDLARDENDITANTWIKDARTWATEKNKKLSKTQKIVDGISNQQENLQDQEQNINDIYDKRIKALERINQLQDQMSKQKQNQLDLADALSRGDVFAAAQAMQKIRADQAALAVEQQKNALEDERDKKTKAINDKQEAAQDGLSSAQKDLAKVQASTFDKTYDSTLKAPDFEEVYKTFGFVYRMSRPDLWFSSDENVKVEMKNNFSSLFGAIGAVGSTGLMGPLGKLIGVAGNLVPKKADGGYISGPGSGTSDSIPARLSNGEYVIRAKAVDALGTDVLDKMNHAEKFADGGMVNTNTLSGIMAASKKKTKAPKVNLKDYNFGTGWLPDWITRPDLVKEENARISFNASKLVASKILQANGITPEKTSFSWSNNSNFRGGYAPGMGPGLSYLGKSQLLFDSSASLDNYAFGNVDAGIPGIVAHEYGHSLNNNIFSSNDKERTQPYPVRMFMGQHEERMADAWAGVIARYSGLPHKYNWDNIAKAKKSKLNVWKSPGHGNEMSRDLAYDMGYAHPEQFLRELGLSIPKEFQNIDWGKNLLSNTKKVPEFWSPTGRYDFADGGYASSDERRSSLKPKRKSKGIIGNAIDAFKNVTSKMGMNPFDIWNPLDPTGGIAQGKFAADVLMNNVPKLLSGKGGWGDAGMAGLAALGFIPGGDKVAKVGKIGAAGAKVASAVQRNAVFLADNTAVDSAKYAQLLETSMKNPGIFDVGGTASLSWDKQGLFLDAFDAFGDFGLGRFGTRSVSSVEEFAQNLAYMLPSRIAQTEATVMALQEVARGVMIDSPQMINSVLLRSGKLNNWRQAGFAPEYLVNSISRFASGDDSVLRQTVKELDQLRNTAHLLPDVAFQAGSEAQQAFMKTIDDISTSFDTGKFLSKGVGYQSMVRPAPVKELLKNPVMKAIMESPDEQALKFFNEIYSGMGKKASDVLRFPGMYQVHTYRPKDELDYTFVNGTIYSKEGDEAGAIARKFYDETVYHQLLNLNEQFQGTGFGTRFSGLSEELYRLMGIKKINLVAGLSKGPYTWAKAGYQWGSSPSNVSMRVQSMLNSPAGRSADEIKILKDLNERFSLPFGSKEYPTPKEIADISILNSEGKKLGKEIFEEFAGYDAVKYLDTIPVNKELSQQMYSILENASNISGINIMDFIPRFKNGGMFRTPYADGGLAMLHDKEFVMNAGAVKDYGVNNLRAMNNGTYTGGSVYNSYGVNINVGGSNSNANDIARTVIREIKRLDSQNIRSTKV